MTRLLTIIALLFATINFINPANAQGLQNIVIFPISVSPEFEKHKDLLGGEIQKALSNSFNVFYGKKVEEALEAEYRKPNCSAATCAQNVLIQFNGELLVDASVKQVEDSTYFVMKVQNIITEELVGIVQERCLKCSFDDVVSFIAKESSALDLSKPKNPASRSSQIGVSEILDMLSDEKNRLSKSIQAPINLEDPPTSDMPIEKKEKASRSYWTWGLGALVLAAGAGGGGGGSGSVSSADGIVDAGQRDSDSDGVPDIYDEFPNDPTLTDGPALQRLTSYFGNSAFRNSSPSRISFPNDGFTIYGQYTANNNIEGNYGWAGTARDLQIQNSSDGQIEWICFPCDNINSGNIYNNDDVVANALEIAAGISTLYSVKTPPDFLLLQGIHDFDNMVFGFRQYPFESDSGSTALNAFVKGREHSSSSSPILGTQRFDGYSIGKYVEGEAYWSSSRVEMAIDFVNETFEISSDDTKLTAVIGDEFVNSSLSSELNFEAAGILSGFYPWRLVAGVDTGISIDAFGPNAHKLIQAKGFAYYGSTADEIGGVFQFQEGNKLYMGAFGAQQP